MPQDSPEALLTTTEVAGLLKLHPKQVYRLVRQGLPGRRVGGEWRFSRREVIGWVERGGSTRGEAAPASAEEARSAVAPPLVAANGDVAVEELLALVNRGGLPLGFVQADRDRALELLGEGAVLAAGSHGKGPPARMGATRLARIHLVQREIGLCARGEVPKLAELGKRKFASRPRTAGVAVHFERAVQRAKLSLERVTARARPMGSHREVVCAVVRGDAEVGLATRAWAERAGLEFALLAEESYGLLVRALDLGEPHVVRLCEVAQSEAYRRALDGVKGYDAREAGVIRYDPEG